jgi:hypothetical protein
MLDFNDFLWVFPGKLENTAIQIRDLISNEPNKMGTLKIQ